MKVAIIKEINDHQLNKLLIVKQILLINNLKNVWRTVWRICILMSGCKGFIDRRLTAVWWEHFPPILVAFFWITDLESDLGQVYCPPHPCCNIFFSKFSCLNASSTKANFPNYNFGFVRKNHLLKVQLLNSNNSIFIYIFHIPKFSLYEKSSPKKTDQSIDSRSKEGGRDGVGGKPTQFPPFFST